jgi:hypothetical protein
MRKQLTLAVLAAVVAFGSSAFGADDTKQSKPKPYPIKRCVVSGEKLDSMGKPYVFTHEGQEVKLCCKNCLKDFEKDPAKYTKKIEDASKAK